MSPYPGSERERRVPASGLQRVVLEIFQRCGLSAADAGLVAETLVIADLQGVHSHGVLRVPEYVQALQVRGVSPTGRPRIARDAGAALVVDGDNSMGQVGATFAMRAAIERARTTGVAVAAVRGSNHCGAMAYFARLAIPHDMIGLAATNALPAMAPWGGIDKILGINPLAVAIPAAREPAIVMDAAFSHSAHGKIRVFQQKGLPIPGHWAFDADGRPTTDPVAAAAGLLQPIGAYKGTGFALVMGILSAALPGASYGTALGNMVDGARPGHDGHFFCALKVSAFDEPDRFKARIDGIVREIHASRRAEGVEYVWVPGEIEAETERRYREEGIPLNSVTLEGLAEVAARLGVDTSGGLDGPR
jgi:LDH2 family malate/lactate/ureidoglycolate dehydrogenase